MKKKRFVVIAIVFGIAMNVNAQVTNESKYGADSEACEVYMSIYNDLYKQWEANKLSRESLSMEMVKAWREVILNCPRASQLIYTRGENILNCLISNNPKDKNAYIDTLCMLMDKRAQYFPNDPKTGKSQVAYVKGRKGFLIYTYNPKRYEEAYKVLKEAIALDPSQLQNPYINTYFRATIDMANNDKINKMEVNNIYQQLLAIINANISGTENERQIKNYKALKDDIDDFYKSYQNLASNSNASGINNVSSNTQNGNNAQLVVNNKSTSKEVNLENGLVAYFPFDYCHLNHTYDISWNGLEGCVYQSIPNEIKHETGYKGKCFHFPLSCRNNHIWVRTGNSLKFPDAVSFAFWFKVEDDGKGQYIGMDDEEKVVLNSGRMKFFYKETEKGAIHGGIDLGKHRIEVFNNDESCSAPFRPDNKWNHVVMVITSSYFTIYLNGNEVAAKNKNKNSNNSNPENLNIGGISRGWSGKYPFHGWIDEFLIYNRELTGAEAKALYQGKEPDKDYLAYKRAEVGSLKDAIAYLKDCTNDSYRKGIEDEIVNTKINSVSDVAYCNDNYPKLADRLEDKTYDLINSVNASADINDCETYLKVFPKGKHKSAVVALKNEIASYNVAKNGGKAECNAYLQKYPNGRFVSEIRSKMDDMDRATVAANNYTGGYEEQKPIVNENNIMDYVESIEIEDYGGDVYYYVTFKGSDVYKGTIKLPSYGDWKWGKGHGTYTITFYQAEPNTKIGALLNLYDAVWRNFH